MLGLVALGGCASMAARYDRPVAPVGTTFAEVPGSPAGGTTAAEIGWQQFFPDARLRQLIGLALTNNRDLRVAVLNIEQTRAQFDVRRADRLPTINAGLSGSRQPQGDGDSTTLYSAGILVTAYELDLFGRVRSLADGALARFFASEEARKAVHISLVAAVANTWLALLADDELLRVTEQTLVTREDSYALTRLRFDNGVSSLVDVRQAESLLASARATLAQVLRQRALDENALVVLVGQPLPNGLASERALGPGIVPGFPDLPAGVPSEVLTRRPDVRQAEQQLFASNADIGAARASFFPRITLTGSFGTASNELSGLFRGGSLGWGLAPQLLQPIFDAGRNRANLQLAEVTREVALAQYERAVQVAFREVADALAGRATLGDQARALSAQVSAERDRFNLADLGYRNGVRSYLDVLDAQRSLFAAEQAEVELRAQVAQNLVTLYRVLGGGWNPGEPAQ
ncbi:MAG: efflux transporter outer membrane subunit [Proteobacteria bacterium]|nr:efflux transporter outer membrane subunit [Burkholderiales bacterium]